MSPIDNFNAVWARCNELKALHIYLQTNNTGALPLDELLRAEWVARVSALDLFVHEMVAQKMMDIFHGSRPTTPNFLKYKVSNDTLLKIRQASNPLLASSTFELDVRTTLARVTYQDPETIADGIRMVTTIELWNELAVTSRGATVTTKNAVATSFKRDLSLIVERRNKIAHEGDLQPTLPRIPWPITTADLQFVANTIQQVVSGINSLV